MRGRRAGPRAAPLYARAARIASPGGRYARQAAGADARSGLAVRVITVKNLRVGFGTMRAVDDVSFHVDAEETFGLVGESGCGKSTLLRVLCGLNRDWHGEITIAGETITPNRSRAFFKDVQMVFQDPYGSLHPRHSVDSVLTEPLSIHRMDRTDARVAEMLDQ